MPIIDIVIIVAVTISVIIGIVRGFVKEAISIAALLVAIWAALFFGPAVGEISESWIASRELQVWFGRILVFAVILSIGLGRPDRGLRGSGGLASRARGELGGLELIGGAEAARRDVRRRA